MGDYFEIFNFFNPTDPVDGAEDEDGDGLANGVEHSVHLTDVFSADTDADGESDSLEIAQGTDPRNAASNNLDADGDLMRTSWEIANDLDPNDAADATGDPDGDLLVNLEEFREGTNPHAADSDADGIDDRLEIQHGFDPTDPGDAQTDTDGDTMPDLWEIVHGLSHTDGIDASDDPDGDFLTNLDEFGAGTKPNLADSDVDGLDDGVEYSTDLTGPDGKAPSTYRTNPAKKDTDDDGFLDGFELARDWHAANPVEGSLDADGDGLTNRAEILVHRTNWEVADTDNDGESDGYEIAQGTNPLDIQSRSALDTDGDHMSDAWETAHGLNPQVPDGGADPDTDGLNNHGEFLAGTHPQNPDCDGDGYFDGLERTYGKDPLSAGDADDDADSDGLPDLWEMKFGLPWQEPNHESNDPEGDGVENLTEFQNQTNPNLGDTDGDGIGDFEEIAGTGTTSNGIHWDYAIFADKADTDGDGETDLFEIEHGTDPTDPASRSSIVVIPPRPPTGANVGAPVDGSPAPTSPYWTFGVVDDSDADGVSDAREQIDGTDPDDATDFISPLAVHLDADRDGLPDPWELDSGLDPSDSTQGWRDPDYDRLHNVRENHQATPPLATWISTPLAGMAPVGAQEGQDPRFPASTLATFNDFNEMARVSLASGQLSVSIFDGSSWGQPEPLPLPFAPLSFGEVVRNNLGLLAVEVRAPATGGAMTVVVVRDAAGQVHVLGENSAWSDVSGIRLSDSGFLAAQAVGPLPEADESIVRWRKGTLLELPHPGSANLKGVNERGELLDGVLGLYRNGAWDDTYSGNHVLGRYGEVGEAPTYPSPASALPYAPFASMSGQGEVVAGAARIDPAEVVRGYHARYQGAPGEFIVTEDDWLPVLEEPYFDDPEISAGGIWSGGAGGQYTYEFEDPGTPVYEFDFDYDDDGFWDDLETAADTDPDDPDDFPGAGANVVVSDANQAGDFVGWIFRGVTETDPATGLEIPRNDAYLWQYRDFRFLGGADHTWVLNNTGAFISSDLVSGEAPDFAVSGAYVVTHAYRLFRPDNDANANGIADDWETYHAVASPVADLDGDGLAAREEFVFATSPNHTDTDGDGLTDRWEIEHGTDPLRRDLGLEGDPDGDTLDWIAESQAGTDPWLDDTDSDGVRDDWEVKHGRNPNSASDGLPASGDFDHDGYTNEQEWVNGTDPFDLRSNSGLVDSDQDQMPDVWEALQGLNPASSSDAAYDWDFDGLTNLQEYQRGTDPRPFWRTVAITGHMGGQGLDQTLAAQSIASFNARGDLARLEFNTAAAEIQLRRWTKLAGWASQPESLGPLAGFSHQLQVRQNLFGAVAATLIKNVGGVAVCELRIRDEAGTVHRLGADLGWKLLSGLHYGDSGFVGVEVWTNAPVADLGNATRFLLRWKNGVTERLALPTATVPGVLGMSERGHALVRDFGLVTSYSPATVSGTGPSSGGISPYGTTGSGLHAPISASHWVQPFYKIRKSGVWASSGVFFRDVYSQINTQPGTSATWADGGSTRLVVRDGILPAGSQIPEYLDEGENPIPWFSFGSDLTRNGDFVGGIVPDLNQTTFSDGTGNPAEPIPFEGFGNAFLAQRGRAGFTPIPASPGSTAPLFREKTRFWRINDAGQILASKAEYLETTVEGDPTPSYGVSTSWYLLVPGADVGGNGLPDDWEWYHFDGPGQNPLADPDNDGLQNRDEFALGLDPNDPDSDGDSGRDGWEVANGFDPLATDAHDTDGDGIADHWEIAHGLDPGDPGDAQGDSDGDGRNTLEEYLAGSDPDDYFDGVTPVIEIVSGNHQVGLPGEILALELLARVRHPSGTPLVNAPLRFTSSSGGGKIVVNTAGSGITLADFVDLRTDGAGLARVHLGSPTPVRFQLPASIAGCSIVASASGASASFSASAVDDPAANKDPVIHLVSGDAQSGAPGDLAPHPLRVRVTSPSGAALPNLPVVFSLPQGSTARLSVSGAEGSEYLTLATLITDSQGFAILRDGTVSSVRFKHPGESGSTSVIVSVGTAPPVSFLLHTDGSGPGANFGEIGGFNVFTLLE